MAATHLFELVANVDEFAIIVICGVKINQHLYLVMVTHKLTLNDDLMHG